MKKHLLIGVLLVLALTVAIMPATLSAQEDDSDTCVPVLPEGWVVYTVQEGDTLDDLALSTVSGVDELIAANCLDSDGTIEVGQAIFLPVDPADDIAPVGLALRCRAEGISMARCRHLAFGDDSGTNLAERCRANGLTVSECRRMVYGTDDAKGLAERCRAGELTVAQCRRLISDSPEFTGLLDFVNSSTFVPLGDQLRDRDRDQTCTEDCDQTPDQIRDQTGDQDQIADQDRNRDQSCGEDCVPAPIGDQHQNREGGSGDPDQGNNDNGHNGGGRRG